jgi:WD40 repeat protein
MSFAFWLIAVGVTTLGPAVSENETRPRAEQVKIGSLAFSADCKELVSLGSDQTIRLWEVHSGKERKHITLVLEKDERAERVGYDAMGAAILLLSKSEGFHFDAATGMTIQGTISNCLLNTSTGKKSPSIKTGHGGRAISPDGKLLAYGDGVWEIASGKKIGKYDLPQGLTYEIKFSSDGKTLAYWLCESLAQNTSMIYLVDVATGKKVLQIGDLGLEVTKFRFRSPPTFSADGKTLAFSEMRTAPDYSIHVWNVSADKEMQTLPQKAYADLLAFSADGKTLLAWDQAHGLVCLWEMATGKERRAVKIGRGVQVLTFSPDGKTAALVKDGTIAFRNLEEYGLHDGHSDQLARTLALASRSGCWPRPTSNWKARRVRQRRNHPSLTLPARQDPEDGSRSTTSAWLGLQRGVQRATTPTSPRGTPPAGASCANPPNRRAGVRDWDAPEPLPQPLKWGSHSTQRQEPA